jgi:hypothetical protein
MPVLFESHVYNKPQVNDLSKIESLYQAKNLGQKDNKNFLLKGSEISNITIKESDANLLNVNLNFNKFILGNDFKLSLNGNIAAKDLESFKNLIKDLFFFYYKNNLNSKDFTLDTVQTYSLNEIIAGISETYIYSCLKVILKLQPNETSLKIPLGYVITKLEGQKSLSDAEGAEPFQKFFIFMNDIVSTYKSNAPIAPAISPANQGINAKQGAGIGQNPNFPPNMANNNAQFQNSAQASPNDFITNALSFYDLQIINEGSNTYFVQKVHLILNYGESFPNEFSFETNILKTAQNFVSSFVGIPPNIPNVDIRNYTNINNKLLILLNTNEGNDIFIMNDSSLFTAEQKNLSKKIAAQKALSYSSEDIFSSGQKQEKYFLIYRTEVIPQSYGDIINEQNIIKKLDITKLETSLDDKIKPNKKYYYCFRVENLDGTASDATLVYEIEMVDQSGTVYLTQNVFKPQLITNFIPELEFENRVRIFPTEAQINIPEKIAIGGTYILDSLAQQNDYISNWQKLIYPNDPFGAINKVENSTDFIPLIQTINAFTTLITNLGMVSLTTPESKDLPEQLRKSWEVSPKIVIFLDARKKQIPYEIQKISSQLQELVKKENLTAEEETLFGELLSQQYNLYALKFLLEVLKFKDTPLLSLIIPDTIFGNNNNRVFKARIESQNSKKKFDVNINYSLQIVQGIKLLKDVTITKEFEVLKTEPI